MCLKVGAGWLENLGRLGCREMNRTDPSLNLTEPRSTFLLSVSSVVPSELIFFATTSFPTSTHR